jgi:hypothetical protein
VWAQCVVDEQFSYVGRRNNISAEKPLQELKSQVCISPLGQVRFSNITPSQDPTPTCVVGLSAISVIAETYAGEYLVDNPDTLCEPYRLGILSLPSLSTRARLVECLTENITIYQIW